ncbi:putative peptide-N4-(N-acetyl-beta-glucosaminyl) asparagine amidase [Rosellinia necatrix]|uniref:Putative peptide-N4-(N-acetyl-beta-glucosaminyl) asparagine amidase n=1 Tax=Rosellinia necatrix TaxID=77044 RepID=A0A1W2TD23_ROSNE|nr:putative peptide-N4-(N-acetyl-beta-glucosaminyl) asparagine amidase [Rosellinia necatrix]
MSMSQPPLNYQQVGDVVARKSYSIVTSETIQALEIARDSPEAACHGTIRDILESALADIWSRVQADEYGYVMSRDEFAIFNFFQYRFRDNPAATRARKRYWDSLSVPLPAPNQQNT